MIGVLGTTGLIRSTVLLRGGPQREETNRQSARARWCESVPRVRHAPRRVAEDRRCCVAGAVEMVEPQVVAGKPATQSSAGRLVEIPVPHGLSEGRTRQAPGATQLGGHRPAQLRDDLARWTS